jgi:hypothetical protein
MINDPHDVPFDAMRGELVHDVLSQQLAAGVTGRRRQRAHESQGAELLR